jgi:GNAT superfamily N-acetyltransferase
MSQFIVDKAALKDSAFLGIAARNAERAHTGRGLWDVLGGDTFDIASVLEHACLNDAKSHLHISRFFVVRDTSAADVVACGCGYIYPDCSIEKSKPGINTALATLYGHTERNISEAWERLSFLDACFPDFEYDGSWMVEAVYTSPDHRGKGLATLVVQAVLDEGRINSGCRKALITCAIGNEAAKRVYERLGFEVVGKGESRDALLALGSPGFYLLCKYF